MVLPTWVFWVTLVVMVIGLAGVILPGVPGVGLIWIAALVYAIAEGFATIDPITFVVLTVLAAVGVTSDIWVSQTGGKLAGASWKALLAGIGLGLVGALIGLIFGVAGFVPGGIIGVGSLRRLSAVKWGVAGNIVVAWILTLPGSALISALGYLGLKAFGVS